MSFFRMRGSAARIVCTLAAAAVVASNAPASARGAVPSSDTFVLPNGPAKAGFDLTRFSPAAYGVFQTFQVTDTVALRDALRSGLVSEDTDLLVTEVVGTSLALLVEQMAYHHLAQGRANGKDWLVSFCVVCNTGTRLVPLVHDRPSRFEAVGVYDGLLVIQDSGTRTLWNHITGEALYGPGVGTSLGPVSNVLHMTVKQALAMQPQARVAISDRLYFAGGRRHGTAPGISLLGRVHRRPDSRSALSDMFSASLSGEDGRRPRMDLGLGVWTATSRRYYPRELLRRNGNALIDTLDGRRLLVYLDPETSTPAAMFVDSTRARLDGTAVRLDRDQVVRDGVLFDGRGGRVAVERPLQVFTRWYGFALTFPATEVYGQE